MVVCRSKQLKKISFVMIALGLITWIFSIILVEGNLYGIIISSSASLTLIIFGVVLYLLFCVKKVKFDKEGFTIYKKKNLWSDIKKIVISYPKIYFIRKDNELDKKGDVVVYKHHLSVDYDYSLAEFLKSNPDIFAKIEDNINYFVQPLKIKERVFHYGKVSSILYPIIIGIAFSIFIVYSYIKDFINEKYGLYVVILCLILIWLGMLFFIVCFLRKVKISIDGISCGRKIFKWDSIRIVGHTSENIYIVTDQEVFFFPFRKEIWDDLN